MRNTITVTSRGQTTLPADIRRKLGVSRTGGELRIDFDERKGEVIISRPLSIIELSERISAHIKPGTSPVLDTDEYYQRHRESKS